MDEFSDSRPMSFTNDVVYRARFIEEATKQGIKFGTNQFRVYHQLRWFEEEGKYGFNVAGFATIGTYVNLTEKEVTAAMNKLRDRGIVQHILTDARWYRKKTDLWATTIHLKRRGIDYVNTRIEAHNRTPNEVVKLVKTNPGGVETNPGGLETNPGGVVATPVITESGNNNINNNINIFSSNEETNKPDASMDVQTEAFNYASLSNDVRIKASNNAAEGFKNTTPNTYSVITEDECAQGVKPKRTRKLTEVDLLVKKIESIVGINEKAPAANRAHYYRNKKATNPVADTDYEKAAKQMMKQEPKYWTIEQVFTNVSKLAMEYNESNKRKGTGF